MARERSGSRDDTFCPHIRRRVSWRHDSRRGSRLGCFFHPRHLPSRYLFKVNGTGLVSQVCPKTGGFCPDLDGFASDHPFRNFYVSPFQPVTWLRDVIKNLSSFFLSFFRFSYYFSLLRVSVTTVFLFFQIESESRFVRIVKNVDKNRRFVLGRIDE